MIPLSKVRLTLFFTNGMSLLTWDRLGMLERETALYRALRPHLGGITFITYGDDRDLNYAQHLDGIDIVCNRWHLSSAWYWLQLARFPAHWHSGAVIYKSNQMPGAETPLALGRRFNKPFIARCGYLHAETIQRRHGFDSPEAIRAIQREKMVFQGADQIVLTTDIMAEAVSKNHQIPIERIQVIPNYVNFDHFSFSSATKPHAGVAKILFIGRLDHQKNPFMLIEALSGLPAELLMIGSGPLQDELQTAASKHQVTVHFLGNQPHELLAKFMHDATLFVLPSRFEGHPKTLLEAMACGMAVIGCAKAPGVCELIRHQETGLLCNPTPYDMRTAILQLINDPPLRKRLGKNAHTWAKAHVSLEQVLSMELELLTKLAQQMHKTTH